MLFIPVSGSSTEVMVYHYLTFLDAIFGGSYVINYNNYYASGGVGQEEVDDNSTKQSLHYAVEPLEEDAVYDLPSGKTYENLGQVPSSSPHHREDSGADKEFINPLYTDKGPASLTEGNQYELVSCLFHQ